MMMMMMIIIEGHGGHLLPRVAQVLAKGSEGKVHERE
jgi:hypothetical protein